MTEQGTARSSATRAPVLKDLAMLDWTVLKDMARSHDFISFRGEGVRTQQRCFGCLKISCEKLLMVMDSAARLNTHEAGRRRREGLHTHDMLHVLLLNGVVACGCRYLLIVVLSTSRHAARWPRPRTRRPVRPTERHQGHRIVARQSRVRQRASSSITALRAASRPLPSRAVPCRLLDHVAQVYMPPCRAAAGSGVQLVDRAHTGCT